MNLQEFQHKIDTAGKPVIVDFWAGWCAPCMMTKPVLETLGQEYAKEVAFLPVNADTARELLQQYRVFSIPTVLAFQDGREVARLTGAQNEAGYRTVFESLAKGKEIKIPMNIFDRLLRLGSGGLLIVLGVMNGNWLLLGLGAVLAFLGVYDRCPIWRALTGILKRN
ncbi:MAG: thioredoxin fold domain-containing protein [Anaerolineales bacterium]|nr:MAG: DUF2892 domain-containing protein [Chloroflexota bacterium]MBE7436645.1 thioredoxin fold domain-containing protein [Anaerolineales bacterium]MCE7859491.1 DUF2892 domain-containing protein [Chloroflexi bacterium CFX2]MCK6583558.1 thioredoxin family protein [Anaerolineales bacterium]GJQ37018.1 MAG: hypothetical protein JETCAE01_30280 [Anaerolineaceae bacterium]